MSTTLPVVNNSGAEVSTYDVTPGSIEREKGDQAVHESVVAFLAASRAGTASTKNRSAVRGGGAKPYRQKGTGRARAGSIRSPLWRGGGVIFGPRPRSFAKSLNKKVRRLALKRALTARIDDGDVIVVDELSFGEPKTKLMTAFLAAIGAGSDSLVVVADLEANVYLSARNIPGVEVMKSASVNTYWMLLFDKIVITKAGFELLEQRLSG